MLSRTLITLVLLTPSLVVFGRDAEDTDVKLRRIVDRYNAAVSEKDWDSAEALAIGAAQKFGAEKAIVQGMLQGAENAQREQQGLPRLQPLGTRPQNSNEIVTLRTYDAGSLPIWSKDGRNANAKLLEAFLAAKVGTKEMADVKIVAVTAENALVVRASADSHKAIAESLESLSRSQ